MNESHHLVSSLASFFEFYTLMSSPGIYLFTWTTSTAPIALHFDIVKKVWTCPGCIHSYHWL